MARKPKDISNQNFDRLVAIRLCEERDRGHAVWECECKCGRTVFVRGSLLRSREVRSCGCLRSELVSQRSSKDITNQQFDKLVAIHPTKRRSNSRSVIWLCKCECGATTFVSEVDLQSGNTTSCGCTRKKKDTVPTQENVGTKK